MAREDLLSRHWWKLAGAGAAAAGCAVCKLTGLDQSPGVAIAKCVVTALASVVVTPAARAVQSVVSSAPLQPTVPQNITPQWLTHVLRARGVLSGEQRVLAADVAELDAGKTSKSARVTLTYSEGVTAAPTSFVLKMSRKDVQGVILNLIIKLYREGDFYSEMAAEFPLAVPKCYYSRVSRFFCHFVIMMEDVAPAEMLFGPKGANKVVEGGGHVNDYGVDVATTESCIEMIAAVHAKYLNDRDVLRHRWVAGTGAWKAGALDGEGRLILSLCTGTWKKTKAMQAKGTWQSTPWPPGFVKMVDDFCVHAEGMWDADIRSGLGIYTLIHGDCHAMNVLRSGVDGRLVFLDFQCVSVDEPLHDVAYFCCLSLTPADRKRHEERIVRTHWSRMVAAGLDASRCPFSLYFERYKYCGMMKVLLILLLLDSLMADGRTDDEILVSLLYHRLQAMFDDHGDPVSVWKRSRDMIAKTADTAASPA